MVVWHSSTGPRFTRSGQGVPGHPGSVEVGHRPPQEIDRIDLEFHQLFQPFERTAEQVADPGRSAEEVSQHGKAAVLWTREEQGRAAGAEHPPLDFGHFQVGIDRLVDPHEFLLGLQIGDTLQEITITHRLCQQKLRNETAAGGRPQKYDKTYCNWRRAGMPTTPRSGYLPLFDSHLAAVDLI